MEWPEPPGTKQSQRMAPRTIQIPDGEYFDQFHRLAEGRSTWLLPKEPVPGVPSIGNPERVDTEDVSFGWFFSTRPVPRCNDERGASFTMRDDRGRVVLIVKNPK